eukprot:scaffold25495_cov121-Isochrysis_galbana.AAC.1
MHEVELAQQRSQFVVVHLHVLENRADRTCAVRDVSVVPCRPCPYYTGSRSLSLRVDFSRL